MSGLSVFFRRYLAASVDANAASVSDPSSTTRPESLGGDPSERPDDIYQSDADETTVEDPYNQSVLLHSQQSVREKPRAMDPPSSFKEWRDEQCNRLQEYLVQRLFAPVAAEPSDDDPDRVMEESESGPSLDPVLETQIEELPPSQEASALASQDVSLNDKVRALPSERRKQGVAPAAASASSLGRNLENAVIPNVSETYFIASHLSELDLYVQQCSLPVVEVNKVWRLRSTLERRRQLSHHSSERYQYDGPLATVYASVLSMEVRQNSKEFVGADETLRRHTEQIHTVSRLLDETSAELTVANGPQPQHSEFFWYGTYAKTMDSILEDANACGPSSHSSAASQEEVYLSLENIPAKCIFPCHSTSDKDTLMRPADWYDSYHTSPCCLCIGGKSAVECQTQNSDDDEDTKAQHIRFDTNIEEEPSNLRIRCWVVVLPLVVSARLTEEAVQQSMENPESAAAPPAVTANVMLPSAILEYEIRPKHPMQKNILDGNSEDDAVLEEMKEIWDYIEKHHKKKRVVPPVIAAPAVAPTAPAAARDASVPPEIGDAVPRLWTTPQRDTGRGMSTPSARNPASITSPVPNEPLLQQLMTPGERMKRRRMDFHLNFQYQKLSDLPDLLVNTEYSFYAAVLSFSQPYRTKRGDWIMSLALIDDSFQLCENALSDSAFVHSITINIFVKPNERERLPMVRCAGDVIRLSNVKVQQWKDEYQLVSTRGSSFVVLRRNSLNSNDTNPEMYPANDENVLMSDMEWEHMLDMWHWAQRRFLLHATMKIAHRFRLSDMRMPDSTQVELYGDESTRGDLTVMVASILPIPSEQLSGVTPRGFLRVWDGTGVPKSDILPIDTEQARESVRQGDPPSICLVKISDIIVKLQDLRNNPDLQPPKALSGRVANVAIWEKQHWDLINEGIVSVGSFIRLRNVQDSLFKDKMFRCLHVHEKSSFTPLPNLTYEVLHLLEEHNNRLLRKEPTNPDSGILPLFAGTREEVLQPANAQGDATVPFVAHVNPTTRLTEISDAAEGKTVAPTPIAHRSLNEFMVATPRFAFVGEVFINRLYPEKSILLARGLESICPLEATCTSRFYRFGLELQQVCDDQTINVIVSDDRCIVQPSIGEVLFGLSATAAISNSAEAISNIEVHFSKSIWKVHISSVVYNGKGYYLLDFLSRI